MGDAAEQLPLEVAAGGVRVGRSQGLCHRQQARSVVVGCSCCCCLHVYVGSFRRSSEYFRRSSSLGSPEGGVLKRHGNSRVVFGKSLRVATTTNWLRASSCLFVPLRASSCLTLRAGVWTPGSGGSRGIPPSLSTTRGILDGSNRPGRGGKGGRERPLEGRRKFSETQFCHSFCAGEPARPVSERANHGTYQRGNVHTWQRTYVATYIRGNVQT